MQLPLSITNAPLASITVSGGASLAAGLTEQLAAQGTYSDKTTQDLTSQSTWQSSDATLATISSTGLLTTLKPGNVVITATSGSVSGTLFVTVSTSTLTSIKISAPSQSLSSGATEQLTATGTYSDNSTQNLTSQVIWQSTDPTIATISSTGVLTSIKTGSTTIIATSGPVTGTLSVAVTAASLTSIKISAPLPYLGSGATEQLTATGTYSDNSKQDFTSQVVWQSSDATIATVSSAGLLTALKPGNVVITATSGSISGTLFVAVSAPTLTSIKVSAPSSSLVSGATELLTATGTYSDNSTQDLTSQVMWQSSDPTTASVSGTGLLTGVKAGSATVTASQGSVSGNIIVSISAPVLLSITITPSSFSIASGQNQQLNAQAVYSNGTTQDVTSTVSWNSSASNVALVSGTGLVSGVSAGTSTITATLGAVSKTATATVSAATLQAISVTPATASIATGQTQAFAANGIFSDGSTTDMTNSIIWSATNAATIDATGLATGLSTGTATIMATSGAVSGSASLTVTSAVVTSIDISPDGETIPIGGQLQLTLTGTYSDNSTQDIANATWSSSDSTTASVDPVTGIVTGVANSNGNPVTITATYGGMTDTTTVYVTAAVPESLTLTPATASIASGTTQQYSVNAIYSDGSIQPVTAGLTWASSSAVTASISAAGLATGIAPGQATITVTYGSLTGTATLTVTQAVLTGIVVTPANSVVGVNGNVQFTATGVFSDNSTQDLSTQAVWSSSVANFALISNTGLASGLSNGVTTITATYGGLSGSAALTVTTATLVSITITPANPIVPPHSKIQMTATGVFSDGTQIALTGLSWHTSSARFARVSSTGVVRTKKSSNKPVPVYASLNGITGQTSITISSMSLQSISLNPSTSTIANGTTEQFALIGTFSDGVTTVDLTASARWQTSNFYNAVINRSGLAMGRAAGTVTITASFQSLVPATATLSVSNATIQSISVTPALPTIALGGLQQFSATGNFSDGSTQDITSISQWTSSTPAVAVINKAGVASSATHGQTNINATFKGVTGTTLLSVN